MVCGYGWGGCVEGGGGGDAFDCICVCSVGGVWCGGVVFRFICNMNIIIC